MPEAVKPENIKTNCLVTHQATATFNRREMFEGREHLVAPVIAVLEGVLNGELCPADEIGRYVDTWNGIPLPIDHPQDRGVNISANRPDLVESRSIGRFWNAIFDGTRLRGELWIDIQKAHSLGGDALTVLQRLENGQPLEVSTAYFRDVEPVSGNFNGRQYNGIQRNLRPDHLALLPHGIGACSWADGAGAPRVNKKGGDGIGMLGYLKAMLSKLPWVNQESDVSHDEIRELLESAMTRETGDAMRFMIRERFDDYFIWQEAAPGGGFTGRIFKREYSIDDDRNVTLGNQEEVRKVVTYEPVNAPAGNAVGNNGNKNNTNVPPVNNDSGQKGSGNNMDKNEFINGLIANEATQFTDADRSFLEGLTEEQLKKMEPVEQPAQNQQEPPAQDQGSQATGEQKTDPPQASPQDPPRTNVNQQEGPKPKTMEDWLKEIPDEGVREFIINSQAKEKAHREKLITDLAANDRCAFDKDELSTMKTTQLEKLAQSMQIEDYSGVGGPRTNIQANDNEVPPPPPVILAKNNKEAK